MLHLHNFQSTNKDQLNPCIIASAPTKRLIHCGFHFSYKHIQPGAAQHIPTLFVSGAFQSMQSWYRFARYFIEQGKPVIIVDLPGTGASDPLPTSFGQDFLAETIGVMLDDAGIERVSIVAASYGTPTAYCFAQFFPHRVDNLVLCGTMKEIPEHLRAGVAHTLIPLRNGDMGQFANEVLGISGPQKGNGLLCTDTTKRVERHKLAKRLLYSQLVNMNKLDRHKYELNTLRLLQHGKINLNSTPSCNTLIFTGEHDCFTLPAFCKEIADAFPACTFTTIRHADHLFHIEQFETTSELLYRFSYNLPIEKVPQLNQIERVGKIYRTSQGSAQPANNPPQRQPQPVNNHSFSEAA
ncbi:alpha/beta fold hydrolase [Synechococcus sp. CCY 0621]|uniref:alpha/beta fold hydrolase n=1 Tax=Synechococcus sp. CCY 0621 TaxID=2815603 RepID=UPI001C210362|nr:alpha/beta fold hydrolase [Synechococcus sp. CCY 0621]